MTFDEGLIKTWRFPRFSALQIDFRQSLSTFTRMIAKEIKIEVVAN